MDWILKLYGLAQCGQVAEIVIKEALGTDLEVEIHSEQPNITILGLGLKAKMEFKEEQTSEVQSTGSLSFALQDKHSCRWRLTLSSL